MTRIKTGRSDDDGVKPSQLKVKFDIIPETTTENFNQLFPGFHTSGLVRSDPGNFVMTQLYGKNVYKIYQMEPRKDDIWLLTFPKSGTTWVSDLLWLLMNNIDIEKAKTESLPSRVTFIDVPFLSSGPDVPVHLKELLANTEKKTSPRIMKSHLPFPLLPPKLLDTSKVIYVARNPKDVVVSYYFHSKLMKLFDYQGDLEKFAEYFMKDEVLYSPYFPHVLDAWSKRNHPNMHFMFFEDMKKNLRGEIKRVANFLNKPMTEEQLLKLVEHLRFDNFEKNESVNNEAGKKMGYMNQNGKFIRKGKTGDWKNYLSPELNSRLDNWIIDNLAGTVLDFVTELEHQD